MDGYTLKDSRRRAFYVLMVTNGLWHFGNEWNKLIYPYITWDTEPRMSMVDIGYLNAIGQFFVFIGSLLQGTFVDALGTKLCAVVSAATHGLYICTVSQGRSFGTLVAAKPLLACGNFQLVAETHVSRITTEKERTHKFMLLTVPVGIAMLAGPYAASRLSVYFELRTLEIICGLAMLATLLPTVMFMLPADESHRQTFGMPSAGQSLEALASQVRFQDYKEMLSEAKFLKTLLIKILIVMPYFAYETFSRQYLISRFVLNPADMATMFIVMGVSVIITNTVLMHFIKDRFTPKQIFNGSVLMLAVAYLIQSQVTSYEQMLIGVPLLVIGISITMAETTTQVTAVVEKHRIGIAVGVSHSMSILASIIQPTIFGYIIQNWGFPYLCYIGTLFSLTALALVQFYGSYMNSRLIELPSQFNARPTHLD